MGTTLYIIKRNRLYDLNRIIDGDWYPDESYSPAQIAEFTVERDEILNVYFEGKEIPD